MQRSRRAVGVLVPVIVASTTLSAGGAAAQPDPEPEPPSLLPMVVEPTSGAVGDSFEVSGSGCLDGLGLGHRVDVYFHALRDGLPPSNAIILTWGRPIDPAEDGTWAGRMTVPAGEGPWATDADTGYGVQARCRVEREEELDGFLHSEMIPTALSARQAVGSG